MNWLLAAFKGKTLFAFLMGLYFALLQTGWFFGLEVFVTAAYPSFATVTGGWLAGSVAGLFFARNFLNSREWKFTGVFIIAAGYAAFAASHIVMRLWRFDEGALLIHAVLIGVAGMGAGAFFAINRNLFASASKLFFVENNGFIAGWLLGFAGFVAMGFEFCLAAPALAGVAGGASSYWNRPARGNL